MITNMKITVIIPVIQIELAHNLIQNIKDNTRIPDEVIIIDNTEKGNFKPKIKHIRIRNNPPQPLNDSWTAGLKMAYRADSQPDLITVLNDDIILNKRFFEILEKIAIVSDKNCGVFCPYTVRHKEDVFSALDTLRYETMYRREGWAFTLRGEFLNKMKPIPGELKTFCGDDWIWLEALNNGYRWVKMMHNPIYHYGSVTIASNKKLRATLDPEKLLFAKLTGISLKVLGNPRLNRERLNGKL